MAYCTPASLSDIEVSCGGNIGGVKVLAVRNRSDIASITAADGVVTALTLATGAADDASVISFKPQVAYLNNEETSNEQNGTAYITNTISFMVAKMDASKRASVEALRHAQTIAIVKDMNGTYWLVGDEEPLHTAVNGTTGTNYGDGNGYTPTMTCVSSVLPSTVSTAAVTTFLGDAEM